MTGAVWLCVSAPVSTSNEGVRNRLIVGHDWCPRGNVPFPLDCRIQSPRTTQYLPTSTVSERLDGNALGGFCISMYGIGTLLVR